MSIKTHDIMQCFDAYEFEREGDVLVIEGLKAGCCPARFAEVAHEGGCIETWDSGGYEPRYFLRLHGVTALAIDIFHADSQGTERRARIRINWDSDTELPHTPGALVLNVKGRRVTPEKIRDAAAAKDSRDLINAQGIDVALCKRTECDVLDAVRAGADSAGFGPQEFAMAWEKAMKVVTIEAAASGTDKSIIPIDFVGRSPDEDIDRLIGVFRRIGLLEDVFVKAIQRALTRVIETSNTYVPLMAVAEVGGGYPRDDLHGRRIVYLPEQGKEPVVLGKDVVLVVHNGAEQHRITLQGGSKLWTRPGVDDAACNSEWIVQYP